MFVTRWRGIVVGLILVVSVSAAVLETGCAAPTLPIPPPTALVSAPDASGMVTVSGHANPAAYVFVLHEETANGVITHADASGMFSVRLPANLGDTITAWQMIGNDASQQIHLVVMP